MRQNCPACERLPTWRLSAESRKLSGLSKQAAGGLPTAATN